METICKNEPNVICVGCIHKDFKSYADRFSKDDAAVMSARITQVDLLNEGIEEIIGAIVEKDKEREFRITPQRMAVLRVLAAIEGHHSVKAVYETFPHPHVICIGCKKVIDLEIGSLKDITKSRRQNRIRHTELSS